MVHRTFLILATLLPCTVVLTSACSSTETPEETAVELLQEGIDAGRDGRLDEAVTLFEQAAAERPDFVDPLMFVANVHERRGDAEAARDAYLRALKIDPTLTAAGAALALTYIREGRFEEGRTWLISCVDTNPGFEPAIFNLGALAERGGDSDAALAWYRLAGALDTAETRAVLQAGVVQLRHGRLEAAKECVERAFVRNPESPGIMQLVAAISAAEASRPRGAPLPSSAD